MKKKSHQFGDQPIEAQYVKQMEAVAGGLDRIFNGEAKGADRKVGFVLLVFEFGEGEGRCNYISNGADREDIIQLFEEQIKRFKAH
jgi:hypothetical protein